MSTIRRTAQAIGEIVQSDEFEQFRLSARDFLSARESGASTSTQIEQIVASLSEATEVLNRSFPSADEETGTYTNVISPVVIPKRSRSYFWLIAALCIAMVGTIGLVAARAIDSALGADIAGLFFGLHYWLLLAAFIGFHLWRNSFVMVPDGCHALITRFGKLEQTAGPGRVWLLNPWKRVSYIVNTTKEYPYNAPIREAPTASRVSASVDLFLQFRIEDPAEFIFTLGGARGFGEKLQNAVSEVTRALIYEQNAAQIYDLVGENTQSLLSSLNNQFLPAVRFVNANITHAEPSDPEYRMDLAAAEVVRVAKEAYTYQYELDLRKEQDEGELDKELATLEETLSAIRAEIATYQAQIDTALEKETNRAEAYAHRLLIEAESEAKARAALLEAQALDIRAATSAFYPEILEYRFQVELLDRLESLSGSLPQVISVGRGEAARVDFQAVARQLLGFEGDSLFSAEDMETLRQRSDKILARSKTRAAEIERLDNPVQATPALTENKDA